MDTNYRDFLLKYGLVIGMVQIMLLLLAYTMGVEYMVSFLLVFANLAVVIGGTVYAGIVWRRFQGGDYPFKEAFKTIFLVYAIAAALLTLFNVTLYTAIDASLPEAIQEAAVEKAVSMMEQFGAPEDQIEETIDQLEENAVEQYTIGSFIQGYFFSLLWGIIVAAIGGAIIKKNEPIFE